MSDGVGACRSCGAVVVFATNVDTGSTMILDGAPDLDRGNVLIDPRTNPARCKVVSKGEAIAQRAQGAATYLSHHATCPDAEKWRRRKRAGARQNGGGR